MRVRAGLVNKIYKKALLLSSNERGRSTGDITNLMSVDATRLQDFCTYGLIAISGPFQVRIEYQMPSNLTRYTPSEDNASLCIPLWNPGLAGFYRCSHYDCFCSLKRCDCSCSEENARKTNEKPRQADTYDERASQQYQEVILIYSAQLYKTTLITHFSH